jgi:hypothetical protein
MLDEKDNNQEWYEGTDPEIDFTELNKAISGSRYTNTVNLF